MFSGGSLEGSSPPTASSCGLMRTISAAAARADTGWRLMGLAQCSGGRGECCCCCCCERGRCEPMPLLEVLPNSRDIFEHCGAPDTLASCVNELGDLLVSCREATGMICVLHGDWCIQRCV
jgi:hypothetical protein